MDPSGSGHNQDDGDARLHAGRVQPRPHSQLPGQALPRRERQASREAQKDGARRRSGTWSDLIETTSDPPPK